MRRQRPLRHWPPTQPIQNILGQLYPPAASRQLRQPVRVQLVQCVDPYRRHRRNLVHSRRADLLVQPIPGLHGANIPIAEWIGDWQSIVAQSHVIHAPAIHRNRPNAFGRHLSRALQSQPHTSFNVLQIPVDRALIRSARSVRKPVYHGDMRLTLAPAKQRDTTALGAQVNGDKSCLWSRNGGRAHRRNASTSPPSTGIR